MGLVKMTEEITGQWEDLQGMHPGARATLYVYCDKCGSFSIESHLGQRKQFLIIVACVIIAAGILAMLQLKYGMYWLGVCITICILAFRYFWGDSNYLCRKCGSVPATNFNTLGYPSDTRILDVPDQLTQKRYFEYIPEWYDLDSSLKSPESRFAVRDNGFQIILHDLGEIKKILFIIIIIPLYPFLVIIYLLSTEVFPKLRKFLSSKEDR